MASGTRAEKLAEYEAASEEARYRDRLLFSSYYLALIFLGVLVQLAFGAYDDGNFTLLTVLSLFGGYSFLLLAGWSYFLRHARNAAWDRRGRLESDLSIRLNERITTEIGEPEGHGDRFFGGFFYWMRERNFTDHIEMMLLPVSGIWFVIAVYVGLFECLGLSLSHLSFLN